MPVPVFPPAPSESAVPNPALALPEQYNVAVDLVDGALTRGWGERVAIRFPAGDWTYSDLAQGVNRAGNALRALGVEMEQRVGVLLYDSPQFASAFFGAIKIGAVAVPLNTQLRAQDYLYMLNDSRARVLFVEADLWPLLQPLRNELTFLRHVVVVRRGAADEAARDRGTLDYDAITGGALHDLEVAPTSRDDAAFWLYSSGSTGFPKGCVHLQHDIRCAIELYAKPLLGINERDVTFSAAKLFFAYGLGNGLYFPLSVGGTTVLYPGRVTADAAFQVINDQRPTIFFGVPTLYAAMLAQPNAQTRFDTSSLRLCVSAGESLPAELFTRWRDRFGVEILDGIGSTEALHIFISNQQGKVVPGSTGYVVPGYEALLLDERGAPVPQGEIGNLVISGDSVCAQYWNKHERSKATVLGRWIQTGDKYYQDERGAFWYCGRSDDMLKVSGQWVSPVEVEAALITHPAVLEAAVVGREDADGLIKPQAYVVLNEGQTPSDELARELQAHVKATLTPVKYPRWIEFTAELPKTATGKIQRYRLREALVGAPHPAAGDAEVAAGE
ncbi:MAG TPA: benzoate-CoA ligase family protein [Ktedonobacterales bacterium]|nr:benzoate-CoA ligase family protein [Ktedonobacterales bacterium]